MTSPPVLPINIERDWLEDFCRRWKVRELPLFGSVIREDFGPQSDIDFLVSFLPEEEWDLLDFVNIQIELSDRFARHVDLVEKKGIRNPFRRRHILANHQVIYAAS